MGTADVDGLVRAACSDGAGRTYTLTYQGRDISGNTSTCAVTVVVPHDQRK